MMKDPSAISTRRGSERARATRQALVAAARRCLAEHGFEGATSTLVAAGAGVSTGAFYAYFSDKHALLAELFGASLDALVDAQEAVLTADRLLDDGLAATLAAAVDRCVDGFRAEGPVLRAALARIAVDDVLQRIYWERHARAAAAADRFLRRAEAAGAVGAGDREARALALVVLLEGLNHPAMLADGDGSQRARAACADALVGLLRPAGA